MIREDRFLLSRRPYAVDLGSLHVREIGEGYTTSTVSAIWFRRRRGETVAVYGHLWDHQNPPARSAIEFLERHDDGRYGGRAEARWDGSTLWAPETPVEVASLRHANSPPGARQLPRSAGRIRRLVDLPALTSSNRSGS
ncbi:hypothetical protein AMIS_19640 [Actinoplanes missouriensis 431]|uniref:Uncharacterized protein n=1 Tax=Actinoplanes missouriensis (strain ATCC 14538 / DSM 43046 / CBS 188.64 / JCM 3121 / NBRC 102363 / NCIMB 12654 / NRRL B-3342 / UNCC 431) TaxID=512565 RepID=I0H2E7_ACTM4|nr:hypothetical protein [Actinoplanes missouriensis]BAL87184.1 hypothetical protein AMIS_19640 [Actinoplanes missouriensis 431]